MNTNDLDGLVLECKNKLGQQKLEEVLHALIVAHAGDGNVLTIVANQGVHHLPDSLVRGELFTLSTGSLDFSSGESARLEFEAHLKKLASKLKSKTWKAIYLVPFGPTLLSAFAKLVVFRVTGIETIDVMHLGSGNYVDIRMNLRELILDGSSGQPT